MHHTPAVPQVFCTNTRLTSYGISIYIKKRLKAQIKSKLTAFCFTAGDWVQVTLLHAKITGAHAPAIFRAEDGT